MPFKNVCFFALCLLVVIITYGVANGQHSILNEGSWYKLAVNKEGVYKINFKLLKKMGIDPDKIDPRNIKVFGNGGGMLPQANSVSRLNDLNENAIQVIGEDDGKFDKGDFILFYAQGPDRSYFDVARDIFFYEKNLYSDKNFYFITVGSTPGIRVQAQGNIGTELPLVQEFDDYIYHELDTYNELKSGQEWFGESFYITPEQTFKFDFPGIINNSTIKVVSDVMGQSVSASSFKLFINNTSVGEQQILPIPGPQYDYGVKGNHKRDTIVVNANSTSASTANEQQIKYEYVGNSGKGYLDFFLISCKRELALYGDQTVFCSSQSLQNAASKFKVAQVNANSTIWDISNLLAPQVQLFSLEGDKAVFSAQTNQLRKYIVFNNNTLVPELVGAINNQNLHSYKTPDAVIVTHPDFLYEAIRLANHRQNFSGLTVAVATTEEVFNEFSSGRQDVSAIRDFTKYLYDKSPGKLKSLILFGRASYDYKNRVFENTNFVPTYESRNSLHPLETYSSDDYFSFLENNEGRWNENPADNNTLDIGVGRLPVKSLEEAANIVNKIIDYDTNIKLFGRWRKDIVFVADDGDGNIHQSQADSLAKRVEKSNPEFSTRRIFLDSYKQIVKPSGESSPDIKKAIQDAVDRGAVVINYTGHGGEKIWSDEKILDDQMIAKFDNKTFPLFVTATCEFGRNDDPGIISSAELSIIKKDGGAIGMITTTRPVNSSTNFKLNKAFYQALFQRESNSFLTLGEIFRRTKNTSVSGVSNRNFSLLGDPTMKLGLPEFKVVINEILNQEGNDSIKALSKVTVRGEIRESSGAKTGDYTGTLDATLFDKESTFTTLGNQNPVYTYKQWNNAIFRGKTSISNGNFEFQFVVPKNIAYQPGKGKFSLYASNKSNSSDATGAEINVVVGKSYSNPAYDNTPPQIELFMGDTTFQAGGTISQNTYLVGKLYDESGINISNYGIGNDILAILDGGDSYILDDYYDAEVDDFRKGIVIFRLRDLKPGTHSITLKAWDNYNNPSQATINFIVSEGDKIKIERFGNYPNPFSETTTLFFTHNRAGDDLQVTGSVYNQMGEILKTFDFSITSSNYKVELPEWNNKTFGEKLSAGLYFVRLNVRSLTNDSKIESVTRLIVN